MLQHLYWPPFVVLAVAAAAAVNGWLLVAPDFRGVLQAVAAQPSWLLALIALQLPRAVFHELGHVSALRREGVRHGAIGVALYVVFPVFFADVTHAHRLTRGQRVRVDLGGMYFDCVSTLALFAAFWATAQPILLLGIVLTLLGMLAEFTPFLRFDGYYLLADLVGVPEPMSLFGPLLRDLWPGRRGAGRRLQLRRTARACCSAISESSSSSWPGRCCCWRWPGTGWPARSPPRERAWAPTRSRPRRPRTGPGQRSTRSAWRPGRWCRSASPSSPPRSSAWPGGAAAPYWGGSPAEPPVYVRCWRSQPMVATHAASACVAL